METPNVAKPKPKNILYSTTFWSIVLLMLSAFFPALKEDLKDGRIDLAEGVDLAQVLVIAGIGIMGRYNASEQNPVFTPKGFPGRDKEEAELLAATPCDTKKEAQATPDTPN